MEQIRELIAQVVKDLYGQDVDIALTRPDKQFGDFSTNVAMQLAKPLGQNPRQVAEEIVAKLSDDSITKAEVAGPGFINIFVSDTKLLELIDAQASKPYSGKTTVVETNNPNPFKAMHIGHAFNAILGDTIANLIEEGGAKTYRVSYHGDVGLHVGKSMFSLLKFVDGDASKLNSIDASERNSFMSKMYAEGSKAYKEDESAKAEIDRLAKLSFTREDPLYDAVYRICFDWSFEQIATNVERLGNKPTVQRFLESDAEVRGVKVVRDNTPAVFTESDGALVFEGSKHGSFDNAFVSSRGTGLYAARDLGLIQLKNEQFHPDKSYIVTAEEQRDYFRGVIAAAELCFPDLKDVTVNIPTGTVKLGTGKMSSRDGDVLDIAWLYDRVSEAITQRGGVADDSSIAAVLRYQFLQIRIGSDVIFDINEAASVTGNSGPYLQYAHARARSILARVTESSHIPGDQLRSDSHVPSEVRSDSVLAAHPGLHDAAATLNSSKLEQDERSLVRKIGEYTETVDQAIAELLPHHICNYLYELAQEFNRFYEKNRVIDDPRQAIRLSLVAHYADTLKNGLAILGIHAPDKM